MTAAEAADEAVALAVDKVEGVDDPTAPAEVNERSGSVDRLVTLAVDKEDNAGAVDRTPVVGTFARELMPDTANLLADRAPLTVVRARLAIEENS